MSQLTPSEITKVRKAALHSVTLSSEMKTNVVDAKLTNFIQEIKKTTFEEWGTRRGGGGQRQNLNQLNSPHDLFATD